MALLDIDKWADRVYSETDVGRSIAVSSAGVVGLVLYLATSDGIIAGFSAVAIFPLVRLLVASKHDRLRKGSERRQKQEEADAVFTSLSDGERSVVEAFVQLGGCVITWSQFNRTTLSGPAIETLMQRELVATSMTADGCSEAFVLSTDIFDAGVRAARSEKGNSVVTRSDHGQSPESDPVPF